MLTTRKREQKLNKEKIQPGVVTPACNSRYLGGRGRKIEVRTILGKLVIRLSQNRKRDIPLRQREEKKKKKTKKNASICLSGTFLQRNDPHTEYSTLSYPWGLDTSQGPQRMPETVDSTKSCVYLLCFILYMSLRVFHLQIRHSKRLTTN